MAFGSFLSNTGEVELSTADGKKIRINKTFRERIGLKLIGLPHLGLRGRARAILGQLHIKKGEKILDAGCGPGLYALHLAEKGKRDNTTGIEIIGIDIDLEKVSLAKELGRRLGNGAKFMQGDLCDLPFSDSYFDSLVCSDVIEHILNDKKALREMARVLKPGGRLVLTTTANNSFTKRFQETFEHCRPGYDKKDFEKLMEGTELLLEEVRPLFSLLGKAAWLANRRLSRHKKLSALFFYPLFWMHLVEYYLQIDYRPFNRMFVAVKKRRI